VSKPQDNNRRNILKAAAAVGLGGFSGITWAGSNIGAMMPGKGWMKLSGEQCEGDGTPLQFVPKTAVDANPLQDELEKYPTCPYCGMNRTKFNRSRHLVHYDDGVADGTCSIHCLAISLALNIDRGPKAIYAPDFGSSAKIKPLVNVEKATYLIGSKLKGTMTMNSKVAFASADAAKAAMGEKGGELSDFDGALKQAYLDIGKNTMMIRKNRAKKRQKMMEKMKKKG
jgi:nitrous oxide reductase accessory protein NosL